VSPLQVIVLVVLSIENLDYALQRGYTRQERPEDRAAVEYGFAHEAAARVQMALSGIQRWLLGTHGVRALDRAPILAHVLGQIARPLHEAPSPLSSNNRASGGAKVQGRVNG